MATVQGQSQTETERNIRLRNKFDRMTVQLQNERSSFRPHWRDLNDYILPRRARFFVSDVNRGEKRNQKIIDSTGTLAARTLRSGMMGGITSPARPWFRLTFPDPQLNEVEAVSQWLFTVTQRMSTVFLKSNLYNVLPILYGDVGVFGTGAMFMEESFEGDVARFYSFPIGSYSIGVDANGRINKFTRDFTMTVDQIVNKFGRTNPNDPEFIDWDRISTTVKSQWERDSRESEYWIRHIIMPNDMFDPSKGLNIFKRYVEAYYEQGATNTGNADSSQPPASDTTNNGRFLLLAGRDFFPVLAPRWEVTGEDIYGTTCPGMIALGDIKQLQLGEKRSMQAVEKMIYPPMVGPTSLRNHKASILPGDITYDDVREGQKGFRPAHEMNFNIQQLEAKQEQTRQRIRRTFFEDLFLQFSTTDRRQITATEVDARTEEKLLALGPVLEQLNQDLLDPLIDNTFELMLRQGLIPPPPEEIQGQDIKVEYISVLAQAQKLVGLGSVERFTQYTGQVASIDPNVLDKVDRDELIDVYGDILSMPPNIVRSDDEVAAIRQERQAAAQQAQRQEQLAAAASTVKDLSQADASPDSGLAVLADAVTAGEV